MEGYRNLSALPSISPLQLSPVVHGYLDYWLL